MANARVLVVEKARGEHGQCLPLGPDYLNPSAMLRLLHVDAYNVQVKREPAGPVIVAYPVDRNGCPRSGPVYEYLPFVNGWRRRGYSIAC